MDLYFADGGWRVERLLYWSWDRGEGCLRIKVAECSDGWYRLVRARLNLSRLNLYVVRTEPMIIISPDTGTALRV